MCFHWLFARAIRTVKVPFQASGQWFELLPGYSALIEKAELEEGKYSYRIKAKYEGPDDSFTRRNIVRIDDPIPQYIDLGMTFLNEDGVDVRSLSPSGGGFISNSGGLGNEYTASGSGSCDACGSITTIQFNFAIDSYVDEMSYTLYDIPVPF